jgi:hypothetical protein
MIHTYRDKKVVGVRFRAIFSKPSGSRIIRDEENNIVDFCWFDGLTKKLL